MSDELQSLRKSIAASMVKIQQAIDDSRVRLQAYEYVMQEIDRIEAEKP